MRKLQHAVAALFSRFGYSVIPTWRLPRRAQATHLRKLLALAQTDLVLDVGANSGQFGTFLRHEVGYGGPLTSFEPAPGLAGRIGAVADAQWRVCALALGSINRVGELNLAAADQYNSFLQPRADPVCTQNRSVGTAAVQIMRLDDWIAADEPSRVARSIMLKIDTQGSELEVLEGAVQTFVRAPILQVELAFRQIYEGAPAYSRVIDFLKHRGYEVSAIYINNPDHFPMLTDVDAYFIARGLAERFLAGKAR